METKLIKIFCEIDDFCLNFQPEIEKFLLSNGKKRQRPGRMSTSEIMTIVVLFHTQGYRNFKHFYCNYVQVHLAKDFPNLVSYTRFVELMPRVFFPLTCFQLLMQTAQATGIAYIDSTTLKVCRNQRIHNHKVFQGLAQRGRNSMGWFFGFKLHLIVNDLGEIISWCLTPGNVADNHHTTVQNLCKGVKGKLFGDKGYISKKLAEKLWEGGVQLITKIRKNMKNRLIPILDKKYLGKRGVIESIIDQLKNIAQIEHSRHRSPDNFLVNLVAGLVAYGFADKKPSVKI